MGLYVDYDNMLLTLYTEWIDCTDMLKKLDPSTEAYAKVSDRCTQLRDDIDAVSRLKSDLEMNKQTAASEFEKAQAEAEFNQRKLEIEQRRTVWSLVLQGLGLATSVAQTLTILNYEQIRYGIASSKAFQWVKKTYDNFKA